jgi:hypothetical protein
LYSEDGSPLQYRINRLGNRSKQEKWIMQAELFNEVHRWVLKGWNTKDPERITEHAVDRRYRIVQEFMKAARNTFGDAWGDPKYHITKPVTLKALIRVCADLAAKDAEPAEGRERRWNNRLAPWSEVVREFRDDGFYERFAAKGQVERVGKIHRYLAGLIRL